jgi:hypothetical protein
VASIVQALSPHALPNDSSLHEAARCLQLDIASILVGELCLHAEVINANQRTNIRRLIRLLLDSGANAKFKARNKRSAVILALDNPHSAYEVVEALLYVPTESELSSMLLA